MLIYGTLIWLLAIGSLAWFDENRRLLYLAMVLPTYLIRLKILGIPTTWLELAIYVVFMVWAIQAAQHHQLKDWWRPLRVYTGPLILLGIGLIVGLAISSDPTISLGIIKGWFIDPILLFIIIANTNRIHSSQTEFDYMVFGLWFSGVVLSLAALWQVSTGQFITVDQRASAWFGSANYLSLYLVPIMVLLLGWWDGIKQGGAGWIVSLGWLIMLIALYFTFSYAGWLALLFGVLIFWWLTFPSVKILWIGLVGVSAAGILEWHSPKLQHLWDLAGRSSSHVRLQVWQTAGLMIKENWLTGIGLGLFEKRYLKFADRLFHPPLEPSVLHAHNIWLQFWVNTGLAGLSGFVWLLVKWFQQIWPGVKEKNFKLVAVFSAMVALLAHGMVDVAYWKNDLSALFWIILALGAILIKPYGRENLPDRH